MLKAGALYFAIVVAFFIAIVSASVLMLAAHYKNTYLKEIRLARLLNNLEASIAFALADDGVFEQVKYLDLYADGTDSAIVVSKQWGLFDLVLVKTFIQQDTLKKSFLMGVPSDDVTALYLSDEDRPLSLSGNTKLVGNVYGPKSGLKKAYIESKPYQNEKLVYQGETKHSTRTLPALDQDMLQSLRAKLNKEDDQVGSTLEKNLTQSFFAPTLYVKVSEKLVLENNSLVGNIMIQSDSLLTIAASSHLDGIQIYAPSIKIEDGFKGNCQLFATDSIIIGNQVHLNYPSVAGLLKAEGAMALPEITMGNDVVFEGIIFTHEAKRSVLQTMVSLGKQTRVKGEVYSTGLLKIEKGVFIEGKASCNRLVMQMPMALYENFLVDVTFDRRIRNPYYLSSRLFRSKEPNKVLTWLN